MVPVMTSKPISVLEYSTVTRRRGLLPAEPEPNPNPDRLSPSRARCACWNGRSRIGRRGRRRGRGRRFPFHDRPLHLIHGACAELAKQRVQDDEYQPQPQPTAPLGP
jgi:hypothetical protein